MGSIIDVDIVYYKHMKKEYIIYC